MTLSSTTASLIRPIHEHDEHILVIKRSAFQDIDTWHGLKAINYAEYATLIQQEREFLPRSLMETDHSYKQIIPYLIFTHEGRFFLMQRQTKATETRLKNKYSLGIGGHIRQEDINGSDIAGWARREFDEEVAYNATYSIEPLGILNDDSNDVGRVHIGLVFLLHGNSADISVKSELKSGKLLSLSECESYYDSMETWTQIVVDFLKNRSID